MRVVIAGSRTITGERAKAEIRQAVKECGWSIDEIIEGGARGVDTAAFDVGHELGIYVTVMPADWTKHGKGAGPIRNRKMAEYAMEHRRGGLILVWDGKSRGSKNMLETARELGMQIHQVVLHD